MRIPGLTLFFIIGLWAAASRCDARADSAGEFDPLLADLGEAVRREHAIPGLAIVVSHDGRVWESYQGVKAAGTTDRVDRDTVFEIGSVSKLFTASLAAYAQETGALSLDDHPSAHWPVLQGAPIDRATLLELGTYAAGGLPLQFPEEIETMPQLEKYFLSWKPEAAAGGVRRYSNPSIGLLGYLASRALQQDFAVALEGTLLPKLGLENTFITVPASRLHDYAWGQNAKTDRVRVQTGAFDAEAYGIKTTAADLIRFLELHVNPSALEPEASRALLLTQRGQYRVGPLVQCLGWERYPFPVSLETWLAGNSPDIIFEANPIAEWSVRHTSSGTFLFNKTGSTNGFGAYVVMIPQRRFALAILANRNYPIPARIRFAHAILGRFNLLQRD